MGNRKTQWLWLLVLLIGCMLSASKAQTASCGFGTLVSERQEPRQTTLMIYMTGSDLESSSAAATKDMQEMLDSGIDFLKTHVVIFTGGSTKWHSDVPDDANAVFHMTAEGFEQVESFEQLSMGSPENLSRFLRFAYEKYPAESYDLILWDHGNGPIVGYCLDKQYEDDTLTLVEMQEALKQSPFSSDNRLGFIGFDACLMASAELVCMLGEYANYLIASQETEPNFGWNYAFLKDYSTLSSKDLSCAIADSYLAYCEEYYASKPFFHSDVTLSVVDLSYQSELQNAVNALFKKTAGEVTSRFNQIAVSRVGTRSFGRASTGSEYDLVDLRNLAQEMEVFCPEESKQLRELLDKMVVASASNTEMSCGLSLYYPFFNKNYYSESWKTAYLDMNVFPDYLNFLHRYEQTWLSADMQEMFDDSLIVELREGGYYLPLSEEQLNVTAEGRYYILRRVGESIYAPIYIGSDVQLTDGGILTTFDGNIVFFKDPFGRKIIPALELMNRMGTKADYNTKGGFFERTDEEGWSVQMTTLQLSVDTESRQVEVKGIYVKDSDEGNGTGKKQEIDLSEWTVLYFMELPNRNLTRAENGRILGFYDWEDGTGTVYAEGLAIADDFYFEMEPLYEDGLEYYLMFELTDVQGNKTCSELFGLELVPAPPDPDPVYTELAWNDDNEAFFEISGIELVFRCGYQLNGWAPCWILEASNSNDFPVEFSIKQFSVGDYAWNQYDSITVNLESGQTVIQRISNVEEQIKMIGTADPARFYFTAMNTAINKTLCYNLPVELKGIHAMQRLPGFPILEANAKEQVIYSDDMLELHLLRMGQEVKRGQLDPQSNEAEMVFYYRIDNLSNETHEIAIPALCINEAMLYYPHFLTSDVIELGANRSLFVKQTWDSGSLKHLQSSYGIPNGEQAILESIASISVLLTVDGEGIWCPIDLATKGTEMDLEAKGTILYEDELWSIYRDADLERDDGMIYLWLVNHTDQMYYGFLSYEGETDDAFWGDGIGPSSVQLIKLNKPNSEKKLDSSKKFELRYYLWEEYIDYANSYGREEMKNRFKTQAFDLQVQEGGE